MTIEVYAKKGCGICEAAKEKLSRMGLSYKAIDLQEVVDYHPTWREDGSVEVLAGYALLGNKVPVIRIGGKYHDYPSAMRALKGMGFAENAARGAAAGCAGSH